MPKAKKKASATKRIAPKKKIVKKTAKKPAKKSAARKKKKVSALPQGYNNVTPYLIVDNAKQAISFYKKVFAAKEILRMEQDNKVGHAELKIGDSKIMLADVCIEMGAFGPENYGGTPVSIHLYVDNVDKVVKNAVASGAKLLRPVTDMFYGDRSGGIEDPFGHKWYVATHMEDVTPVEMRKRSKALFGKK